MNYNSAYIRGRVMNLATNTQFSR